MQKFWHIAGTFAIIASPVASGFLAIIYAVEGRYLFASAWLFLMVVNIASETARRYYKDNQAELNAEIAANIVRIVMAKATTPTTDTTKEKP